VAAHSLEIQMQKITTFELPMQRPSEMITVSKSVPLPSFNLSLEEITKNGNSRYADGSMNETFDADEEFDYLKITFTIGGDDPRIKAFDVYTQYSGIRTVLIKHTSKSIWPLGIMFYFFYPDWDDWQDRMLTVGQVVPTTMIEPADYVGASGLLAKSWTKEGSENGEITLGMCRGNDSGAKTSFYGGPDDLGGLAADLGHTIEFDPGGMGSGCALESHNPICSYTYIWKDYHPIPFACYNIWTYINDDLGRGYFQFMLEPYGVAFATYQPEWLKAGIIVGITGSGPYNYSVKCIRMSNNGVLSSDLMAVIGVFLHYEIGRWVILSKEGTDKWHIIPSSGLYWEKAVEFLREHTGW